MRARVGMCVEAPFCLAFLFLFQQWKKKEEKKENDWRLKKYNSMLVLRKEDCVSLPTDACGMTFVVVFLAAGKWLFVF